MREGQKYIELTYVIAEEDGQFASHCEELGTASCGKTLDEALENLRDAVDLHLNTLEKLGERARFFRERNIRLKTYHKPRRPLPRVSRKVDRYDWAKTERVPV